ncbi:hypothetical protein ACYULU_14245 [Breznakiellaceae bacterium SP9]
MTDTALLLKEIEGLPPNYVSEVLDFVAYLKHKASLEMCEKAAAKMIPCPVPQKTRDWRDLCGLFKSDGREVDRFLERSHADTLLEDEINEQHRKERSPLTGGSVQ